MQIPKMRRMSVVLLLLQGLSDIGLDNTQRNLSSNPGGAMCKGNSHYYSFIIISYLLLLILLYSTCPFLSFPMILVMSFVICLRTVTM